MDLQHLKKNWHALGKSDPLFSILAFPEKKNNKWDAQDFFRTGEEEINDILGYVRSLNLTLNPGRALDFGCGAGRLTQALGRHFQQTWGVDIAPSMIRLAQQYNRLGDRCQYLQISSNRLPEFKDGQFDFIYSCRVLQHIEPSICKDYIREFVRLLSPSGVLVFQQPAAVIRAELPAESASTEARRPTPKASAPAPNAVTRQNASPSCTTKARLKQYTPPVVYKLYWWLKLRWLSWLDKQQPKVEMHSITKEEMVSWLLEFGASSVDIREDDSAPGFLSLRYCVVKSSQAS